eukprot:15357126-Ditylum_brightwellii.AAC.1
MDGGECEFDINPKSTLRLYPVTFGSRRTVGNERHFHSHAGESLAASWGSNKCRHFLWGRPYILILDQYALKWIVTYKGNNHAVMRLQLDLLNMFFTLVHRPGTMLEDANFFSRLGEDTHIDPLLKDYMQFTCQMHVQHLPDKGKITPDNLPGCRKKQKPNSVTESTTVNLAQ